MSVDANEILRVKNLFERALAGDESVQNRLVETVTDHERTQVNGGGFYLSWYRGEDSIYINFPETDAGEAGATLIPAKLLRMIILGSEHDNLHP